MDQTDTTTAPDLVASTGVNDPNSPWNGLLQTALTTGTSALQAALTHQTPIQAPGSSAPGQSGSAAAAAAVKAKGYMPWIIGGAIVAVLAWLLFRK